MYDWLVCDMLVRRKQKKFMVVFIAEGLGF
jgi:hypothetical protein